MILQMVKFILDLRDQLAEPTEPIFKAAIDAHAAIQAQAAFSMQHAMQPVVAK